MTNDIHINDYMILLKKKFPRKAGPQDTLQQQKKSIPYPWTHIHDDFIQIFLVNDNNWVCVERENNSIQLFDSMNKKTTKSAVHIIARYVASNLKKDIREDISNKLLNY